MTFTKGRKSKSRKNFADISKKFQIDGEKLKKTFSLKVM